MIRKVALEVVLFGLLVYSVIMVRGIAVDYDPLADMKDSGASISRSSSNLPPMEYTATGGKGILKKQIFHPSRSSRVETPTQNPDTSSSAAPAIMPNLLLVGILENPKGERLAILEVEGGKANQYSVGDVFAGFKVVEVGMLEVKLERDGEPLKLKLRNQALSKKRNSSKNKASKRRSSRRRSSRDRLSRERPSRGR